MNSIKISAAAKYIIICLDKAIVFLKLCEDHLSSLLSVSHFLSTLRVSPECLELWSNGDGIKDSMESLDITTTVFQPHLIIPGFIAFRTPVKMSIWSNKHSAGVYAHVIDQGCYSAEVSKYLLDVVEAWE